MPARRALLPVLVAAGALLAPAGASAAAISLGPSCPRYVPGAATVAVAGIGFTPGSAVSLRAGAQTFGTLTAGPDGRLLGAVPAPAVAPRHSRKTSDVSAVDSAGVAAPSVRLRVSNVLVRLPARARPSSRVRFRAYGFPNGRPVYMHVRRHGHTLRTVRVTRRAHSPCGTASRRMRYLPISHYHTGTYDYAFSNHHRYSRASTIYRLRISIVRRVRSAGAMAARR